MNQNVEIIVYHKFWINLLLGISSLLLASAGIYIMAEDGFIHISKIILGCMSGLFFGVGGILVCFYAVYDYVKRIPHLVIYHDKVEIWALTGASCQTIYFDEIQQFRIVTIGSSKQIAVDYKPEHLDRKMASDTTSNFIRLLMTFNINKIGAAESIPASNLTVKANELCRILNEHLDKKPGNPQNK